MSQIYTREAATITTAVKLGTNLSSGAASVGHARWIQVVGDGTIVAKNEDGTSATFVCVGGEVITGRFREITSADTRIRYGNGDVPPVVQPESVGLLAIEADLIEAEADIDALELAVVTPVDDPGHAAAIPVTRSAAIGLDIADAAETNTLAVPAFAGQELLLYATALAGSGTRAVTVTGGVDVAGNDTLTFDAAGQSAVLRAIDVGGTLRWALTHADGAAASGA